MDGSVHGRHVVRAHLVAEAPRAAVDHHRDLAGVQSKDRCSSCVEQPIDHLHLEEMIPGSKGSQLVGAPSPRPLRKLARVRTGQAAALLGGEQIVRRAVPDGNSPLGAPQQHMTELVVPEALPGMSSHAARYGVEQGVRKSIRNRSHVAVGQVGAEQPDAAVDIEADPARADDALIHGKGRHAADREAIPPMQVRHAERGPHDPRQGGNVGHLAQAGIVAQRFDQRVIREDESVDPHAGPAIAGDPPAKRIDPLEHDVAFSDEGAHTSK